jgi:hypothetical protein
MECPTITKCLQNYKEGKYDTLDSLFENYLWYDWFCSDKSLIGRTKRFIPVLNRIKAGGKINPDKDVIELKNCCPCQGPLYDRIQVYNDTSNFAQFMIAYRDEREMITNGNKPWTVIRPFPNDEQTLDLDGAVHFSDVYELADWLNAS